jgi:hypothetical protein
MLNQMEDLFKMLLASASPDVKEEFEEMWTKCLQIVHQGQTGELVLRTAPLKDEQDASEES